MSDPKKMNPHHLCNRLFHVLNDTYLTLNDKHKSAINHVNCLSQELFSLIFNNRHTAACLSRSLQAAAAHREKVNLTDLTMLYVRMVNVWRDPLRQNRK